MTPLEIVLMVLLGLSMFAHWARGPAFENVVKELDYLRNLYADAIAQLEKAVSERNYYRREWAARWDAHARTYGTPPPPFFGTTGADGANASQQPRHVGAGE